MHRALVSRLVVCAVPFLALASEASADPNGTPVCTAAGDQQMPVIVPDGLGGAVIAWHDARPGAPAGGVCYAQRVDASGTPLWTAGGVPLSTSGDVNDPVIVGDGGGGAYVVFGGQGTTPRMQYINAAGVVQWGADGLSLSTTTQARELAIARDFGGAGYLLAAWRQDNGNGGSSDVFAQMVSFAGVLQWNPAGQAIANTTANEMLPAVISDGGGGAVIAWINATSGSVMIFGLKSNGVGRWSRFSLSASANNTAPSIVPDGFGGAVVGWAGGGNHLQRVSGLGTVLWRAGGVLLSTGGDMVSLLGDGAGGVFAAWQDFRSGTNYNIYVQRLLGDGAPLWGAGGSAVCTATQDQKLPQIVSDDSTGAIITWFDYRTSGATGSDIYAQHFGATGTAQWLTDGIPLCAAPDDQEYPTLASDKAGGAFIVWQDRRSGTDYDIYLQRVGPEAATLAVPPGSPEASSRAWPNPFSDRVQMPFALPAPEQVRMSVVDVGGRIVRDLGSSWMTGGAHQLQWDGVTSAGTRVAPGLYFLRVSGSGLALSRPVVRLQ